MRLLRRSAHARDQAGKATADGLSRWI
jgi:hypothetical protein